MRAVFCICCRDSLGARLRQRRTAALHPRAGITRHRFAGCPPSPMLRGSFAFARRWRRREGKLDVHIRRRRISINVDYCVCVCVFYTNSAAILLLQYLAWPENVRRACPSGWWLGVCSHLFSICPRTRRCTSARATDCAGKRAFGNRVAAWPKLAPYRCFGYI